MLPLMVASPDVTRSGATSLSATENPASAHTWAMPLPIWPAPITPTLRIVSFISLVRSMNFAARATGASLCFAAVPSRRQAPFYADCGRDATGRTVSKRSEEHTSELQSLTNLVCRLLLEKKKKKHIENWNTQMREMRMRLEGCHNRRHDARDVFRSASCHLMTEAGAQP